LIAGGKGAKLYFGGDTGYKTVRDGEDEDSLPHNPDFAEIGRVFGDFDLALLPIGYATLSVPSACFPYAHLRAYAPRSMWSNLHASPIDSVHIFQDLRAKKALAMHWG
jgi:N-acyl-phosphatidylethanolamine-hydrolysing phospholipase D